MLGDEALLLGSQELVEPIAIDLLRHPARICAGQLYLRTRYLRWVTPGASTTLVHSSSG